jgi:threonine/homoserine/homoserine lactone efflux protein
LDLSLFAKGVLFGLGAAVPIGPVNVEIARRTLRSGFAAGFFLGCGAVTVDVCFAVLAAIGITPLLNRQWIYWPLAAAGFGLLVFLGVGSLRAAWQAARTDVLASASAVPSKRSSYLTGLAMTAFNPFTWGFWFIVLPQVAGSITQRPGDDLPIICLGVFVGTIAWVIFFTGLLSVAGRVKRRGWLVLADVIGGVLLLWFAGLLLLKSLQRLYNPAR